eukprot:752624-Hanusia_phi.AAC.2
MSTLQAQHANREISGLSLWLSGITMMMFMTVKSNICRSHSHASVFLFHTSASLTAGLYQAYGPVKRPGQR